MKIKKRLLLAISNLLLLAFEGCPELTAAVAAAGENVVATAAIVAAAVAALIVGRPSRQCCDDARQTQAWALSRGCHL